MSSRFFASISEDEYSSESESSDEENAVQTQQQGGDNMRFAYIDSSSDEESGREVRSEKDKRFDDMRDQIVTLKNSLKIKDYVNTLKHFDALNKLLEKAKNVIRSEGIPNFYFAAVLAVEADCDLPRAVIRKLAKTHGKAINAMKAKLKKWRVEHEEAIEQYIANPQPEETKKDTASSDEDDLTEDGSDSEEGGVEGKNAGGEFDNEFDNEFDSEFDSDGSGSEYDDSDSEDEDLAFELKKEQEAGAENNGLGPMYQRSFWTKKPEDLEKLKMKAQARIDAMQRKEERRALRRTQQKNELKLQGGSKKAKAKRTAKDFTPEAVVRKLKDLLALVGKRSTNRRDLIDELEILEAGATESGALLKIRTSLIGAYFELNLNKGTHMPLKSWLKTAAMLTKISEQLVADAGVVRLAEDDELSENFDGDVVDTSEADSIRSVMSSGRKATTTPATTEAGEEKAAADKATEAAAAAADSGPAPQVVIGSMFGFVHRLALEHEKALRNIDSHDAKYVDSLKQEPTLISLLEKTRVYYQTIKKKKLESEVVQEQLELMYYHRIDTFDKQSPNYVAQEVKKSTHSQLGRVQNLVSSRNAILDLCMFSYKHGSARVRTRALLVHVYHLALHNHFAEARDLLLMSHVQDAINSADVKTRVLFNRTMAQVGICAFRVGQFWDALNCLQDLFQSLRVKELLGQGLSALRYNERDPVQEKIEKQRQYPFHMFINQDMLECGYLIGSMFSEVPNLVATGTFTGKRVVSKQFRRLYDQLLRQAFTAPPEKSPHYIMFAARSILDGNWQAAMAYLEQLKMWFLVPNADTVKAILLLRIKESSLKCFLKTYGSKFSSLTVDSLCVRFALDKKVIKRIVSKMIYDRRIEAAWDQPSGCLIMYKDNKNELEKSAVKFADKADLLTEQNERLFNPRHIFQKNNRRKNYKGKGGSRGGRGRHTGGGRKKQSSKRSNRR